MSTDYFDWRGCYDGWHTTFPLRRRRPVIGITGNYGEKGCELAEGYYRSLLCAGAVPLIIPPYEECDAMADMLERVDGLLLSGGGDLNPLFMGEEPIPELHSVNYRRDKAELLLIRMAYDRQIYRLKEEIKQNRDSAAYYRSQREALVTGTHDLEHIAREQYHMQRPTEDVFILK